MQKGTSRPRRHSVTASQIVTDNVKVIEGDLRKVGTATTITTAPDVRSFPERIVDL